MKTISRLLLLALLALASTSAHADGNHWHPYLGGGYCRGGIWLPPVVIAVGPSAPPPLPPPAVSGGQRPIPVGFVDGPYLRSPWSTAAIPLSSIREHGQIVYDSQTGLPFRAP